MLLLYRFHFLDVCRHFRTCCACTCKDYVCIHSQPKWLCHFGSSLILCQEKLVKNPPTHALTMAAVALTANPPVDIPAALQVGIDKLSSPLKTLLMGKVVPYIIQHRLGEDGYVTMLLLYRFHFLDVCRHIYIYIYISILQKILIFKDTM